MMKLGVLSFVSAATAVSVSVDVHPERLAQVRPVLLYLSPRRPHHLSFHALRSLPSAASPCISRRGKGYKAPIGTPQLLLCFFLSVMLFTVSRRVHWMIQLTFNLRSCRQQIQEINSKQSTWHAAPQERFAHLPPGASQHLLGVKGDWVADVSPLRLARNEVHHLTKPFFSSGQQLDRDR